MVRLAGQGELGPRNALHAFDRADGEAFRLQRRPLLDVQLDIGVDVGAADRRRPAIADAVEFFAGDFAVDADRGQRRLERHRAGEDQAAEHVGLEARAFLVGEEGDGERPLGDHAGVVERLDHFEPAEHAERAIVMAAGRHGVDVAADHHRRAVLLAAPQADDVADRVDGDREPQLAHPLDDQVAARLVGFGQRQSANAAVGPRPFSRQPLQARDQPRAIDPQILTHLMSPP